jgi:midasin
MKPLVERQRHLARKSELTERIEAEKLFELHFTGQGSSQRLQTIEHRLIALGDEPPNSSIARPVESEMSSLQGDFSNVLRVVIDSQPHQRLLDSILRRADGFEQQARLFQTNLSQLVERLEMGHPVYKDMTDPVIGFLYYLKLGLSLAVMTPEAAAAGADARVFLAPHENIELPQMPLKVEQEAQMLWLRQYAARSTTEGGYENLDAAAREKIHAIFQRLFRKWKAETEEEKEKAIAESRTYQYRGETEDHDEQEFKRMFPDYEGDAEEEESKEPKLSDHKQIAIRLAQLQSALLTTSIDNLSVLIREGAAVWMKAAGENTSTFSPEQIEEFLPAIFLSLKATTSWISGTSSSTTTKKYDFYNDENLAQAHHVVSIVKAVHKRMSGLLENWPENVTLQDAVETCQELFSFPAATPVAKFLTKVEKLHSILNEWQSVASREFSAAEHYDKLTQLIISWRRLELTTWPRLFDLEDEKQKELALSWWFFLYESVIANPLELLAADLEKHVQQLIASLISFFTGSSLGQFPHRLQLIRVFALHVSKLCADFADMEKVRDALQAVVVYYEQYEPTVKEELRKERKTVEKAVADVVLLASWKDTNIIALRDSAKRSHHKLYKTVRKYRQMLDVSVMGIISGGMANEEAKPATAVALGDTEIDATLVKKTYEATVKAWDARPPRLRDLPGALGMMQRVSKVPETKLDVAHFLDRFASSIIATVKELQAETPATMSADVKDVVKHLKTRKRKAFTDALKELRQMGLRSNLSRAQLLKQDSLERILASAASLQDDSTVINTDAAQHYFVRICETLMKVRAVKEPSPDLQGNDTARVTGFMEHLLSINIQQRASLSAALKEFAKTRTRMEEYRELADMHIEPPTLHGTEAVTTARWADALRKLRWLPKLLAFTLDLVQIRAEFAGSAVEQMLQRALEEWRGRASDLAAQLAKEKLVHARIWKASTKTLLEQAEEFLRDIQARVTGLLSQHADIRYAFAPLLRWVSAIALPAADGETATEETTVQELDAALQKLSDSIFVALQKLNEAQSAYPAETTDAGWLLTYQAASAASMKALYMRSITHKIESVIAQAAGCVPTASGAVRAVFAAYFPIVQEYVNTCQRVLQQVAAGHRALGKASYVLCTTAATLLTKGFCEPAERSDQGGESKGELETGTGLGEGEGAEDISKDIKDDEDLSELAQEKNKEERENEIEDEEDAVDMGEEEMEGEMGDKEQKEGDEEDGDEKEEEEDMEEETGDVDDLDPTAVDEKMWDEKADDDDKEKDGDASKGKQNKGDELEAKKEDQKQQQGETGEQGEEEQRDDEDGSEDEGGAEQEDDIRQQEKEGMDEHVPKVDTLDLPEEMQLDGDDSEDEKEGGEDGDDLMDDLPDMPDNEPEKDEGKGEGEDQEEKFPELDAPEEPDTGKPEEKEGEDEDMGEEQGDGVQDDPENPEEPQSEDQDENMLTQQEDNAKEADETAPSDNQAVQGGADNQDKADQASAQQESGEESKSDDPQQGQGTENNESQTQNQEVGATSAQDTDPAQEQQQPQEKASEEEKTFRKVGDILEKWHRQRKQILDASEEDKDRPQLDNMVS